VTGVQTCALPIFTNGLANVVLGMHEDPYSTASN
jgi:hypothetical protein